MKKQAKVTVKLKAKVTMKAKQVLVTLRVKEKATVEAKVKNKAKGREKKARVLVKQVLVTVTPEQGLERPWGSKAQYTNVCMQCALPRPRQVFLRARMGSTGQRSYGS